MCKTNITLKFEILYLIIDKVSLQTNLERNPSNYLYIFLLDVNFKILIRWIACYIC